MPSIDNAPEVSTDLITAEATALVHESSLTELETVISTALVRGEDLLRRSDLGRIEFTINELKVTSREELSNATQYVVALKDGREKFKQYWNSKTSLKKVFHSLHELICKSESAGIKRFDNCIRQVGELIKGYEKQLEQQAKDEQERIAKAAEAIRDMKEKEAHVLLLEGKPKEAARAKEQARNLITPVLPVPVVELEGLSRRSVWEVNVHDPMALVKAIAAGEVPIEAIKEFNLPWLRDQARQQNGLSYPGVTATPDTSLARKRG